jgi:hypothetical protein
VARGCRNVVLRQVGSYLGYTGRAANPFRKAARDPKQTLNSTGSAFAGAIGALRVWQ